MFRKRIRHTKRYQEILNTFILNGFSHFFYRIGLTKRTDASRSDSDVNLNVRDIGIKLRLAFQRLGPTFIKLGQIASSRRDIVPEEIAKELEKLQDDVTPFSFETVREIIQFELGDTIENLFDSFNKTPLATASIGQVHIARLFSGEEVAIKIQRPDIQETIETDLEILHDIAHIIESRIEWAKRYEIKDMIDEYGNSLRNELNYGIEGRNGERIAKQFKKQKHIIVPEIYWDYSSNKILTMKLIKGIKVSNIHLLEEPDYDRKLIAKRLTNAMLEQVLEAGFFHGDPHSGNIYILPNNAIAFLDFGMVGQLNDRLKYHFASLVINLQQGNSEGIIKTFTTMDLLDNDTNINALYRDLESLQMKYYDVPLNQISLGAIMIETFSIAHRHQIKLPSDITILGKVIITLEGIIEKLDPEFSIMQAVEPFGKKLIKQRFHPKNIIKRYTTELIDSVQILSDLPKELQNITSTISKGKLRLDINITELKSFLHRLDKISNRISFSIILLAFSILMTGLIIGASISGQTALLWSLPVIEIGAVIAALMFLFMMYSIFRSGRM